MADLSAFLSQNKIKQENMKFVASKSFIDENGNPMEWEIRALSTSESDAIKKECTRRVKIKGNQYTMETDTDAYVGKLAAACTVFPNLNDAALQNSYGVMGGDNLLKAMLSVGEYTAYTNKISEINGFDVAMDDIVEEAKN